MVKKRLSITLFAIFFLLTSSGFSTNPAPLFATPLPAGRMLDEGHDTGYIDWNGSVYYENLYHRDGLCGSGCNETVTRINSGASISGSFERDVMYFEAMVASEFGAGTVTVTACSVSRNVYMGTASPTDAGFVSIPIISAIPSGCRDWSVSASGGHVHVRSVDVIYPQPPTINGVLNCSSWGMNDWCTGTENLDLTAYEPQGASVIISGDLNGDPFTCLPGLTCSNPITEEGTGTANYQALSTNGIGSGSTDWKLDTLSPDINAGLVGSFNGLNWSNTDVTLNASVSDATSGVSYFESSLDNATWTPQTSPLTLNFSDGTRTIYLHAVDRAGNIESVQYEIKVDTQDPQLTETFTGTSGSNAWYISDVQVAIAQSDPYPSSGIQYFAYSKDGGATWTNYTTPFTLSEGVYDLQMHLVDNADNQDLKSQEIKVDTTVPSISGSLDQIPNAQGWIDTDVNLTASASDSTSGVASFESSLDNAIWTAQSSPLTLNFSDGTYTVYLRAIDNAGHEYLLTQEIKVDSQSPVLGYQIQGTLGDNHWYTSAIQVEVTQVDPAPSSGIQSFQTSLDGTNWMDYSAPLNFSEGVYVLQMRTLDNADNLDMDGVPLNVDTTPPTIDATLSGTLGSNNIYISPVEAVVSVSDNLSGIATTEYMLNGSAWQPYSNQLTLNEGDYELQFRTKDTAGLLSTTQVYDFSVDTHGPNIKLPSRWYIWETGDLFVKDDGSGIASVSYEIRDREGRWKKVEQSWDLDQEIFTYEITWNRVFADGTLAPDGEYPVRVTATDHAGHSSQKTALIIVPPANATLLPTFTATPTQTQTPSPTPTAMETQSLATTTAMPTMTSTPFVFTTATPTQKSGGGFFGFGNPPQQTDTDPQNPNPLIGITAAAVTGAYIATQRKKKVDFGSAPKEAKQAPAVPNVFDGEQAAALMSAFTAKMEEDRQRRIAEKALAAEEAEKQNILNYQAVQRRIQEIARAREEARRRRQEAKRKAAVNPLQALWDANGAAIYAANQNFKATYGRDMDAATRKKAIKDATVNGHFNAGAYAGNLVKAATPPPKKEDPYAGIGDWVDRQDKSNAKMLDEVSELEKWAALQKQKNAPVDSATASYMAMGAAVEAGKFSKEDYDKARKQVKEGNCPWWNLSCHVKKIGNAVSTFWQEKVIKPVKRTWNKYVYQPIIQPVIRWWKDDVPSWTKEFGLSLIPIVGDGLGLVRQATNWFRKEPVDKLDVTLSAIGLIFDLPFDGLIAGDLAIASLKGFSAAIPPGPARDMIAQMLRNSAKNPDEIARIAKVGEALLENDALLKALINNPQALESVMRVGPEAIEILGKHGDEVIELVGRHGDKSLKYLLDGGANSVENLKFLDSLPGDPGRILTDLTSGSPTSEIGALFQLEQLKALDPSTIRGVEVPIPGGRADAILVDGTIIDYKALNWSSYKDFIQESELNKILEQIEDYKRYKNAQGLDGPIKIVFTEKVPEIVEDAIKNAGAIVEVP